MSEVSTSPTMALQVHILHVDISKLSTQNYTKTRRRIRFFGQKPGTLIFTPNARCAFRGVHHYYWDGIWLKKCHEPHEDSNSIPLVAIGFDPSLGLHGSPMVSMSLNHWGLDLPSGMGPCSGLLNACHIEKSHRVTGWNLAITKARALSAVLPFNWLNMVKLIAIHHSSLQACPKC